MTHFLNIIVILCISILLLGCSDKKSDQDASSGLQIPNIESQPGQPIFSVPTVGHMIDWNAWVGGSVPEEAAVQRVADEHKRIEKATETDST